MKLLIELFQLVTENNQQHSTDGYFNHLKNFGIQLSRHIDVASNLYNEMLTKYDQHRAHMIANARLTKWFSDNYLSSRETGIGLGELLRHFSKQTTGPIKHQFLELANLPVYSKVDSTGSKGTGANMKFICANFPAVLYSYGKQIGRKDLQDLADRIEQQWKKYLSDTSVAKKVTGRRGVDATDVSDIDYTPDRERNQMRGTQASGAEALINATLNRIPNERLRHVIRTEVMKSDNKLSTLDRLLVQYNIELN